MWTFQKEQPSPAAAPRPRAVQKGELEGRKWGALEVGDPAEVARRQLTGLVSIARMPTPQPHPPPCVSFATTLAHN